MRLGGAEHQLARLLAEHRLDRLGLGDVALLGRGAVGVDVAHVLGIDLAVRQAGAHRPLGALAVLGRRGDVVGVAARAVAQHLAQDPGAPPLGVLQALEHHDRAAVAQHEAVAVPVERPARGLGRVVPAGQRLHVGEGRHGEAGDGRLGAAGHHGVGHAVPDHVERIADGVRRRGAGRHRGVVGSLEPVPDGDEPGRDVGNEHRDEEGGDPVGTLGDVGACSCPRRSASRRCRCR